MKNLLPLLAFFSLLTLTAQQKFNSKNLEVTYADLQINHYTKDSIANALVLYEQGNSFIDPSTFRLITEVEKKVKIFSKDDSDQTNVEIYLYKSSSNKERIKDITAITYNMNGNQIGKTFLKDSDIFEEEYNSNYTIIKFTLPNIKDGSVITYKYTLDSPYINKYKSWYFQDDVPKLFSRYIASIPGNYHYNIRLIGHLKFSKKDSKLLKECLSSGTAHADCAKTTYEMTDIPAFIEEDFMTTKFNYLSKIEYDLKTIKYFDGRVDQVTRSWKDADKEMRGYKSLGRQFKKKNLIKDILPEAILNESDSYKKAQLIYDFVQNNYVWNKNNFNFKKLVVKDLLKSKSGNVAQINLLLHNFLIENGISSKPVLLSTRNNGLPTKLFPVIFDFNYLVVQATINDQVYMLDATDKYLSFGQLPFRALNGYGRLLDFKKGSSWVDIENNDVSAVQYQLKFDLSADAELSGQINSRYTNYYALNKKKVYYPDPEKYLEDFENGFDYIEVEEHQVKSQGIDDTKFQETFLLNPVELESNGNTLYLSPFFFKFISSNPFKLQERTYPIEFGYKRAFSYNFQITFDDSVYELGELPKNLQVQLPNNTGKFRFICNSNGNKISLLFLVEIKEVRFHPEYYEHLKAFMARIVDTQTKTLLEFKKK